MIDLTTLRNPFRDNVVQDAWQCPADVPEIHDDVFRACLSGIESASRGTPDSLLIYGPAGSGKTHLLTRLQRHLAETAADAPDRVLRCVFVFVRLQTSPSLLWQHVRRRLASDLMRRDQGVTQLQRLIAHQMSVREGTSPHARVMELRVLSRADHETLSAHLKDVARNLDLPRDLCVVLEHLACNRFVRDASAWLAGESLPEPVLSELGVGPDVAEDREELARDTVTALCRLAGETLPIVFCFDQVEALQRGLDDRDAFFRFGQMAADLFDADANVFLITCLQSGLLETFQASIRHANRDRMGRRSTVLEALTRGQVEKLLASRMDQFPELPRSKENPLFPLSASHVTEIAAETPCVPRRVLAAAARAFEVLQHGRPAPPPVTSDFLRREFGERSAELARTSTPADTTRVLMQGLEPLAALGGIKSVDRNPQAADFILEAEQKVAGQIRNEADGRSLAPRLKKLLASTPREDGARSVILRDPRLPISKSALKTREHLATLQDRGVSLVEPTVEALSALAALAEILADAKAGDLANEGNPLSEGAVLEWLRALRQDLLLEPVQELVDAILIGTGKDSDATEQDLGELLARERAVPLEAAGEQLGVPVARLLEIARERSDRFLVLEGPPEVVLDVSGVAPELEGG